MNFELSKQILKINLKRNFLPHFIIALIIFILTPIVFEISSLDQTRSAQPIEMMLSLTGIIILTPVFLPEQNQNIRDLIRSKKIDYVQICALRVLYSLLALAFIVGGFIILMHHFESQVTIKHFFGGFASALFLGSIGFLCAGLSKNSTVGYMVSMIYYIVNFTLKDKLGKLYLFSMSSNSFNEKYFLLTASIIFIAATLMAMKKIK